MSTVPPAADNARSGTSMGLLRVDVRASASATTDIFLVIMSPFVGAAAKPGPQTVEATTEVTIPSGCRPMVGKSEPLFSTGK